MRRALILILAAVAFMVTVVAYADEVFHWRHVGGNPYRGPHATAERALELSGFPEMVQVMFLEEFNQHLAKQGSIKGGDAFGFVTFGDGLAEHNVLADWSPTITYTADVYPPIYFGGKVYTFLKVHRCGNYVGSAGKVIAVQPPETFARGAFVKTECVEGVSCNICD